MSPAPSTTSAGTREPASGPTESLSPSEVQDARDTSPRVEAKPVTGKRVRAITYKGGTQVHVRRSDFANNGIDHDDVTWDFRQVKGDFAIPVGTEKGELSEEAAKMLTEKFPAQFEYINDAPAESE